MSRVTELENKIKELSNKRTELIKELKVEKQKLEILYPLKMDETHYIIDTNGDVVGSWWYKDGFNKERSIVGNVFYTEQEPQKERDRLILLTRFRRFRDKCNGDWKPESDKIKYYICLKCKSLRLSVSSSIFWDAFNMFGYFKSEKDCERAIEIFGDEIKRLFVEEE